MINYPNPNFNDLPGRRAIPRNFRRGPDACNHIDVSIITPYYNTEAFFIETFVSLQAQSLQNWEWIIVDDGSTNEESVKRLSEVALKDSRIKVIRQKNAGPAAARNKAFENSRGRYVCLLDSDDMIEPTYLEKCMWFLDSNPEFSFCNSYSVVFGEQEYLWMQGFERNKDHLRANSGPPISLIRREAYAEVGGFDASIRFGHEDWDFWLAMAKAGRWGYTIREFLQWYRKCGNGRFEQIMKTKNVNEQFEKLMHQKYSGLQNRFPNPQRRHQQPYESIETEWLANNNLAPNLNGRRIMFVIPWMVVGGADRVNLDIIEGLVNNGHEVTVCATLAANHSWEHKFSELTPDIFILPNILHLTDYPRFVAYLIQSRQIDTVVISGSTMGYQLLPYLRSVSPNTSFIDITHVEEPHWLNGGHPRFAVGYQDALDINVVTTKHLAKWMESRGANLERIRVMYTGVRIPAFNLEGENRQAILERLGIVDKAPVIVFSGRICDQKRPLLLAEILKLVSDEGLSYNALIIGDGELRSQLEGLLDQYGLKSKVKMLGSLPHEQWLEILSVSDILLMPSLYEGISVALLEAMAAGVVPVVANVGGHAEVVQQDMGFLISHGVSEIMEYVTVLSNLITQRDQLQAKSERCCAVVANNYSWVKSVDEFDKIITDAQLMRVEQPRHGLSVNLAKEWVTIALENKRLSDAVDWLWSKKDRTESGQLVSSGIEGAASLVRIYVLLSQTKLGRFLLKNNIVKNIGRKLLANLEKTKK